MRDLEYRAWNGKGYIFFTIDHNCLNGLTEIDEYIGRKDTNGQKIFENDFVEIRDLKTGAIFRGVVKLKNSSFCVETETGSMYRWMDYEVAVLDNKLNKN